MPTHEHLSKEYFHLQNTVESFDSRALTIKAWSVTASLAALGAAFSQDAPALCLVASFSALFFWLIEVRWKHFQLAYMGRIREIESWYRKQDPEFPVFQISQSWRSYFHEAQVDQNSSSASVSTETKLNKPKVAFWPHVMMPHLPVLIGGIVIFVWNYLRPFIGQN